MFVDRVIISFQAGNGGNGCVSFRREKFLPRGGPDGGDGGKGGDVVLVSKPAKQSLVDYFYQKLIQAEKGGHGQGAKKSGKSGRDTVLCVPAGTVVKSYPAEKLLFDFDREGLRFLVAQGGKGGRGNVHFKSSVNQAPRRAEKGEKGENITVVLELKLIAYAGLVGLPNAGKSTLISKISAARPKIADYPFTTLTPHLGVVFQGDRNLVVADIPGIIAGAHQGEGMGLEFLRHIERTRILILVIDGSPLAMVAPLDAFQTLCRELSEYQPALLRKSMLVVINKIDLLGPDRGPVAALVGACRQKKIDCLEISALRGTNIPQLKRKMFSLSHET